MILLQMFTQKSTLLSLMLLSVVTISSAAESSAPAIGRGLPDFELKDVRGNTHSLETYNSNKLIVLAVLGTECPLAKQYAVKLQKLADKYTGKSVAFIAVDANQQDSLSDIVAFARKNSLTFPILKDLNQKVIDNLQATRTPEVFVLDSRRVIRYRGRVDDQFIFGGHSRPAPTREDLKVAIDELLDEKPVSMPETTAFGCLIGRTRPPKPSSKVTYSKQIARILQKNCIDCHRPGQHAPFSLTDYEEVACWADTIAEVTQSRQMPPWHASPDVGHLANERRLTNEELDLIREWADAGAPEGNRSDLPLPKAFTPGWQLSRKPDLVISMARPYKVSAKGPIDYKYFFIDPGLTEDKWISEAEVIPGNRSVVQHVTVFMTSDGKIRDEFRQMITLFVPGSQGLRYPDGMAKRIPAGSQMIFEVHYTPNGVVTEDQSRIGLIFTDPASVTHEVRTTATESRRFKIEPLLENQSVHANPRTVLDDCLLLSFLPLMQLRGKSFRFELTMPDGTHETLLEVPRYDFNWKNTYHLTEPKFIPKNSKVQGIAVYDNSPNNIANPDPSKTVTWGTQTWDEMALGIFDVAVPLNPDLPASQK